MTEWRRCPRCNKPCDLVPISPMFDKDGSRYGFQFYCVECGWYDPDQFLTKEEARQVEDEKVYHDIRANLKGEQQ